MVEIDLFLYAGEKSLGTSVIIALDFGFVWVGEIGLVSMWRVELNLIFCQAIGIDFVLYGGCKLIGFDIWIEINLVFVSKHRNLFEFRVGIETDLISVVGGNKLDFVQEIEVQ